MHASLERFCDKVRAALDAQPGPAGRAQVARLLSEAIAERDFVEACFAEPASGRRLLYRDPRQDFCLLAYDMTEPRRSPPHDHGESWAVYGQVSGHTDMTEYRRSDGGMGPGAAQLSEERRYRLSPGEAGLYDVGAIHSIDYPAGARFVRITGTDLESHTRLKFDLDQGQAVEISSTSVPENG